MSSSPEARVHAGGLADLHPVARPELRTGVWTRLGDSSVLGDDITEATLGTLAERTRTAARAQGYAVGWAEGRREALARADEAAADAARERARAERRREDEHELAVATLGLAADELRVAAQDICDRIAEQATELALEVTHELVAHELAVATDPGAGVVRRVLAVLPTGPFVTVRLHASAASSPALEELAARGASVVVDPDLSPGDALVETESSVLDLRVSTALQRLREVLA
jgi:flagellar assembly protein FliH